VEFQLTPYSTISRNPDILANEIGSETVMMSIQLGKYFGINKTGSYIWKQLESPMTFQELCSRIIADFDLQPAQCEQEVKVFIEEMSKEKIINIS
jgi:hypothetical protein